MPRKILKAKGRREGGAFVPMPCDVLSHQNFMILTGNALRMLMYLCSQLRFKKGGTINNGDLCATISMMREQGWSSNESIQFALKELIYYGFIVISRQGHRKRCSLYAITWWAIDECNEKLDIHPTAIPLGYWKESKKKWKRPKRKDKSIFDVIKSVPRLSEVMCRNTGHNR